MHYRQVLLIAALAAASVAAPTRRSGQHRHEERDVLPDHWKKHSRALPEHVLPMRIALRQKNLEHGESFLMDVSDPASPNYAQHWTPERVAETFAPSEESIEQVLNWLHESGISKHRTAMSSAFNWIHFNASIDEVEALLDTDYHHYEHATTGDLHVACDYYHIPHHLRDHVDFIMPTTGLDALQPIQRRYAEEDASEAHMANMLFVDTDAVKMEFNSSKPPGYLLNGTNGCRTFSTIECLRAIYKFPIATLSDASNVMGIAEWADYLYLPNLPPFFRALTKPEIPAKTRPEFISIDGGKTSNLTVAKKGLAGESTLDFSIAYSIIYPQQLRLYQNGDGVNVNSVGTFNIFLDALDASYCTYMGGDSKKYDPQYPDPKPGGYKGKLQCGGATRSNVISFSYGQEEVNLSRFYQQRQCNEWMKLGLMGTSAIFASGDSGVAQRYNAGFPNKCLEPHSNKKSVNGTRFSPGFPGNCPYVTTVGGTQLINDSINGGEEAVDPKASNAKNPHTAFYSGGGFSNVFARPKYQDAAVTHFLTKYPPGYGPNVYNQSAVRAYPDVSALAISIPIVYLGQVFTSGGTSASAPMVGSIINLINEERIKAGKKPVGFVNPVFYAHPEMFNDVTKGVNRGCINGGFKAQPGWDPVTGLGTPNYQKMLKVFMSLP